MPENTEIYWIEDPKQLSLLASAVRQSIMNSVAELGECSISDLSVELGLPADSLYYHIRKLLDSGLLIEKGIQVTTRRDETVYSLAYPKMRLRYKPADPQNVELISKIVSSMLRAANRNFKTGFEYESVNITFPLRNLWAAYNTGWLSDDDLKEVNQLLNRLSEIFEKQKKEDDHHFCSLTFALSPLQPQPKRRDSSG